MGIPLEMWRYSPDTRMALRIGLATLADMVAQESGAVVQRMESQGLRRGKLLALGRLIASQDIAIDVPSRLVETLRTAIALTLAVAEDDGLLPQVLWDQGRVRRELLVMLGRLYPGSLDDLLAA